MKEPVLIWNFKLRETFLGHIMNLGELSCLPRQNYDNHKQLEQQCCSKISGSKMLFLAQSRCILRHSPSPVHIAEWNFKIGKRQKHLREWRTELAEQREAISRCHWKCWRCAFKVLRWLRAQMHPSHSQNRGIERSSTLCVMLFVWLFYLQLCCCVCNILGAATFGRRSWREFCEAEGCAPMHV